MRFKNLIETTSSLLSLADKAQQKVGGTAAAVAGLTREVDKLDDDHDKTRERVAVLESEVEALRNMVGDFIEVVQAGEPTRSSTGSRR